MTKRREHAVLTGDIINSSRLAPAQLRSVRTIISSSVTAIGRWHRGLVPAKVEFFRGDGWQFVLSDPSHALRAALYLRASLRARGLADTRISIGIASPGRSSSRRIGTSTGPAFTLSGRGLDHLPPSSSLTIELSSNLEPLTSYLRLTAHLCDALLLRWTHRQAQLLCIALRPTEPSYESIAQRLTPPVTKQAVAKNLKSANYPVLREAIHLLSSTFSSTSVNPLRLTSKKQPLQVDAYHLTP